MSSGNTIGLNLANVLQASDYYAFGMTMPGRTFSSATGYRYGFNGKELNPELQGATYDYGFRIYDARIAKFLSVDPLTKGYPWNSTYAFAENTPMACIDLDGLETQLSSITGQVTYGVYLRLNKTTVYQVKMAIKDKNPHWLSEIPWGIYASEAYPSGNSFTEAIHGQGFKIVSYNISGSPYQIPAIGIGISYSKKEGYTFSVDEDYQTGALNYIEGLLPTPGHTMAAHFYSALNTYIVNTYYPKISSAKDSYKSFNLLSINYGRDNKITFASDIYGKSSSVKASAAPLTPLQIKILTWKPMTDQEFSKFLNQNIHHYTPTTTTTNTNIPATPTSIPDSGTHGANGNSSGGSGTQNDL